jgi:RND superfamily putative drug exporter
MQQTRNLAARAGRWSAHHRKKAILGWFAFVILATVLGGMVGQKTLADEDMGNGQSKTADQILESAGFPDQTGESVLVQGKGDLKVGDQRYTAIVDDVVATLSQTKHVDDVENPLAKGNEGNISDDGRSTLVTFELPGDEDAAKDRVGDSLAAVAQLQKAHPEVELAQFGDASA